LNVHEKATAKIDYTTNQSWPLEYSSILLDGGMKWAAACFFEGKGLILPANRNHGPYTSGIH